MNKSGNLLLEPNKVISELQGFVQYNLVCFLLVALTIVTRKLASFHGAPYYSIYTDGIGTLL